MSRNRIALIVAAVLGALIWALSRPITGKVEPWDANSPYYYAALLAAGFACGLFVRADKKAHYLGAVLGQALYGIIFLPGSGLFVLGVIVLFVYSLLFLAGAALGMRVNRPALEKEEAE